MKLKKLAPIFTLLLPLALLSGCGGTAELDLLANWYADETHHQLINGQKETLTYEVIYTPPTEAQKPFAEYHYDKGSYIAVLQEHSSLAGEAEWATGTGYTFVTDFSISGTYKITGGEETPFTDTIHSEVSFANVGEMLRPIRSYKEFHTTSQTETYGLKFVRYEYSYTATYNQKLTETQITVRDLRTDVKDEDKLDLSKKLKLKGSGTFLDNEQILLALRAVDLSMNFSFRTVNPVTHARENVTMASSAKEGKYTGSFIRNGTSTGETPLAVTTFAIGYTSKKSGMTQTLTYALPSEKNFRNALIEMKTTAPDGLGTFTYRLKELTTF